MVLDRICGILFHTTKSGFNWPSKNGNKERGGGGGVESIPHTSWIFQTPYNLGLRLLTHVKVFVRSLFKVSSQSRKFEFNVFSIIHLIDHNFWSFDVLDRFQNNNVFKTAQIMNNISRSSKKWQFCHHGNCDLLNWKFRRIPVWLNHSNYVVKTEFF